MVDIKNINSLGPVWPSSATKPSPAIKERKQPARDQSQQQHQQDVNKDDDEPNHIDEYA